MILKLASKSWCHFVSNLQRYDTISAHVATSEKKLQYTGAACNLISILYILPWNVKKGIIGK